MMKEKTSEEKVKMGFSMLASARKIFLSTVQDKKNKRELLFLRFYGDDFDYETGQKIISRIKQINEDHI